MKHRFQAIFALVLVGIGVLFARSNELQREIIKLELDPQKPAQSQAFFKLGLDVTRFNRSTHTAHVLVNQRQRAQLEQLGFEFSTVLADADEFARQLRQTGYLKHFHSYDQILARLQAVVAQHPDIARLVDIGDSYEKTAGRGGYDIWMLKISDNVALQEDEPEVLFMANMHAREIITPEIILYFMQYLVDQYQRDPYITYLVNHRQIWLCPTFNPDGHEYVFSGENPLDRTYNDPMWWRKNKSDNDVNGRFDPNNDGVDLNRNFGYRWGYDNSGSSPSPWSETFRGFSAFSEPESQAIRDFVLAHHFVISLCFHSYAQEWLYPYGYANILTPDHEIFVALADSCTAYNHYQPGTAYGLYPVNGDSDDWLYGEQTLKPKIFAFTPEVGNEFESLGRWTGFFPDTSFIQKQILENQGPMLYLTDVAGEEPILEPDLIPDTEDTTGPYPTKVRITAPLKLTQAAGIDLNTCKVYFNTTGQAPFDSAALMATNLPGEYAGAISVAGDRHRIYYYFSAADIKGRRGFAPRVAPAQLLSFWVGSDTTRPQIQHTPLLNQPVEVTGYPVKAIVTDKIGIARVSLYFRNNAGPLDSLLMQPTANPNEYQAQIVLPLVQVGDAIEYRMVAYDKARISNWNASPAVGFYRFEVVQFLRFDFESSSQNFQTHSGSDWQWGIPTSGPRLAHSGTCVWATKVGGNYTNNSDSRLDSPPFDLKGMSQVTLSFWHWYLNEASENSLWDGGNVKISADGGPFEILIPFDGYDGVIDPYNEVNGNQPAFGGEPQNGNFWHPEYFDLTPFVNKTVVLRFHFSSDNNTTAPGWYLDDVQLTMSPEKPPRITNTTRFSDTDNTRGPYLIQAKITDDTGLAQTELGFSTDALQSFTFMPMNPIGQDWFQGQIPGQPKGSTVHYFIRATDQTGKVSTDPSDAPGTTYTFNIVTQPPRLTITPLQLQFTIASDQSLIDSLLVMNAGQLALNFTVHDSLLSQAAFPALRPTLVNRAPLRINFSHLNTLLRTSKFWPRIQTGRFLRDPRTLEPSPPNRAANFEEILTPYPALESGLQSVRVSLGDAAIAFEISWATPALPDSAWLVVAIDANQKNENEIFPIFGIAPGLPAEYVCWCDLSNTLALPQPVAILFDRRTAHICGVVPMTLADHRCTLILSRELLQENDSNFNFRIGAAVGSVPATIDWIPNAGMGTVGSHAGAPWLELDPTKGTIPAGDSLFVRLKIDGTQLLPGQYQLLLVFDSNDPVQPRRMVPLNLTVTPKTGVASPDTPAEIPRYFELHQNYPNPFNPRTTIQVDLPHASMVTLKIYNLNGAEVQTLLQGYLPGGSRLVEWNGVDHHGIRVGSGIYWIKLTADHYSQTRKMLLLP